MFLKDHVPVQPLRPWNRKQRPNPLSLPSLPPHFLHLTGHLEALILRPEPPFTGVSGPSGPEIAKKSQKGFLGGLEKSLEKYPKKSKNIDFRTFLGIFSVFLDFFGYFSRLFSRPPKRPFLRLFCDFGPGGPGDSCKWRLGSQPLSEGGTPFPSQTKHDRRQTNSLHFSPVSLSSPGCHNGPSFEVENSDWTPKIVTKSPKIRRFCRKGGSFSR